MKHCPTCNAPYDEEGHHGIPDPLPVPPWRGRIFLDDEGNYQHQEDFERGK